MRKNQIDAARVNVQRLHREPFADLGECHRRAFEMPTRPPSSKRRVPRGAYRLVLGVRLLPEREVARIVLGVFIAGDARANLDLPAVEPRQAAVGRKLGDREIDGAVLSFVCDSALQQPRNERDHRRHVLRGARIHVRGLDAQVVAVFEKRLREGLRVHGQLFPRRARRLDRAVVDIGQVHDLEDLVARIFEPAPQQIFEQKRAEIADVSVVPDGGTAGVQRHARRGERCERLNATRECVEEGDLLRHCGETY